MGNVERHFSKTHELHKILYLNINTNENILMEVYALPIYSINEQYLI